MPVEPSYAFNTFNTMGASNGSGVEMTDSFEDFRKKTNGIINRIENFAVAPVAYGLVTWTLNGNTPTFSIENSFNVKEIRFDTETGIKINFNKPTKDSNFMPYGNLSSRDSTISPSGWAILPEGTQDIRLILEQLFFTHQQQLQLICFSIERVLKTMQ